MTSKTPLVPSVSEHRISDRARGTRKTTLALIAFVIAAAFAASVALAREINLGKHSQDEIKNACNAHGGDLLGVSDHGSYGCEYGDTGTLILCDKNQNCTGYVEARTKTDHTKLLGNLKVTDRPAAKPVTK